MKTRQYIYAECYGAIYRFTPTRWKALVTKVANGGTEVLYSDYGDFVGSLSHNITDLDEEQAKRILEDMNATPRT